MKNNKYNPKSPVFPLFSHILPLDCSPEEPFPPVPPTDTRDLDDLDEISAFVDELIGKLEHFREDPVGMQRDKLIAFILRNMVFLCEAVALKVPGVLSGYYWNDEFYKDLDHTEKYDKDSSKIYLDIPGLLLYVVINDLYSGIAGETLEADAADIINIFN